MVDVKEFAATMQQIAREREALNAASADLQEQWLLKRRSRRSAAGARRKEAIPALLALTGKLANFHDSRPQKAAFERAGTATTFAPAGSSNLAAHREICDRWTRLTHRGRNGVAMRLAGIEQPC